MQANSNNNKYIIIDFGKNDRKNLHKQTISNKWQNDIFEFLNKWNDNSDTISIKTSGSTGKPKTITAKKQYLTASSKMTCSFFNLTEKSTALLCLSTDYIAGKMMIVRAITAKMKLICIPPSNNPVEQLTFDIDFAAMIPYQVQQAIKKPEKFNLIKKLIIGGGRVENSLINNLQNFNVNCFETFGMTETYSHIALRQLSPVKQKYFKTLNNIAISQNKNKELIIDAENIGVTNLKTNDIVEIIDNDSFIWKGRRDFVINSGGIKLHPEEIESEISDLIHTKFYITGIPDKSLGEKAILIIEGKKFDTTDLLSKIKQRLPKYHQPKEIRFIDKFQLTLSGKIKRILLF